MTTTEERLTDYAASLEFGDLSPAVVRAAKRRIIDTLGCAVAAYAEPPALIARKMAVPVAGDSGARVIGSLVRTTPDLAAFANGVMLRYLDFNDTHRTLDGSHPSDNLAGVLAVAEATGASGADFILALAISYEIQCRFVDSVPFNDNGWDQPVPGVMACALACGRLLGLGREALRHALAIAAIANLCTYQTRAGELSMWKGCAAANGARQGVFAAQLAREGLTGPYEAFDGVFGLWKQTVGKPYDLKPLAAAGEEGFAIAQSNIKMYPARDSCQLPVATARDLRQKVAAADIASLKIETYASAHKGAVADPELWAPKTRETADHSMLVAVAATLIDGTVTPDTFANRRFLDADVLDLIGRTEVVVCDAFSAETPGVRNCRIEATAAGGAVHIAHGKLTTGDVQRGPSDDEIEAKYRNNTRNHMAEGEREQLLELLWDLDNLGDIGRLVDRLAI